MIAGSVDPASRALAYRLFLALGALLLATIVAAIISGGGDGGSPSAATADVRTAHLPVYWKVHTGDTYDRIAGRTGLTVDQLETFNPYINPAEIAPGQKIKLRLHVPPPPPPRKGPVWWTVRSGQTFASIAARTGHSTPVLVKLNRKRGLTPTNLHPGDHVRLRR